MAATNSMATGIRPTSVRRVSKKLQSYLRGIFTHFFFFFFKANVQIHPLLKARVVSVKWPHSKKSFSSSAPILFISFIW
ncbi:hypothetical protein TIFTF001_052317, partial [Ficus carica]